MPFITHQSPQPLERRDIAAAVATAITLAGLAGGVRFALAPTSQSRFPAADSVADDDLQPAPSAHEGVASRTPHTRGVLR